MYTEEGKVMGDGVRDAGAVGATHRSAEGARAVRVASVASDAMGVSAVFAAHRQARASGACVRVANSFSP